VSKLSIALSELTISTFSFTPILSTPLEFLVRSLNNFEVQILLSKGH